MNLLLLRPEELSPDGTAAVRGARAAHVHGFIAHRPGASLRVGVVGGGLGMAEVIETTADEIRLRVGPLASPPGRAGVTLLLAMPRPKALRRIFPAVAALGVDRVVLLNAGNVARGYFGSPVLSPAERERLLWQGLEQAVDTRLP